MGADDTCGATVVRVSALIDAGVAGPALQDVVPLARVRRARHLRETRHGRGRIVREVTG